MIGVLWKRESRLIHLHGCRLPTSQLFSVFTIHIHGLRWTLAVSDSEFPVSLTLSITSLTGLVWTRLIWAGFAERVVCPWYCLAVFRVLLFLRDFVCFRRPIVTPCLNQNAQLSRITSKGYVWNYIPLSECRKWSGVSIRLSFVHAWMFLEIRSPRWPPAVDVRCRTGWSSRRGFSPGSATRTGPPTNAWSPTSTDPACTTGKKVPALASASGLAKATRCKLANFLNCRISCKRRKDCFLLPVTRNISGGFHQCWLLTHQFCCCCCLVYSPWLNTPLLVCRRNVSARVPDRQTNQRAEILAAVFAATTASESGVEYLELHTDSRFLMNCVEKWVPGWKANGWRKTNGDPVKNRLELKELDAMSQRIKIRYVSASTLDFFLLLCAWFNSLRFLCWVQSVSSIIISCFLGILISSQVLMTSFFVLQKFVRAHSGIRGNEEADRLAKAGAYLQ